MGQGKGFAGGAVTGLTIGQRPESRLVPKLIKTPEIPGIEGGDRFGVELAWLEGSLSLQAEAIGLNISRDQGFSDLFFWAGYAQVSYFLTGERASTAARPVCLAG